MESLKMTKRPFWGGMKMLTEACACVKKRKRVAVNIGREVGASATKREGECRYVLEREGGLKAYLGRYV